MIGNVREEHRSLCRREVPDRRAEEGDHAAVTTREVRQVRVEVRHNRVNCE